jgi:hypothetical protein
LALSLFIQAFVFIISGALQHKMEENIYQWLAVNINKDEIL